MNYPMSAGEAANRVWKIEYEDMEKENKRLRGLLESAPSADDVGYIEEWFYHYDSWLAKVEKELGDD